MAYRLKDYRESLIGAVTAVMRESSGRIVSNEEVVDLTRRRRHVESTGSISRALGHLKSRGLVERVKRGYWRWIGEDNEQDTKI